jgi:hypothetical protein
VFARIGSERVCPPYWLPPRKRTERATLPREGPPRVGVPNCTGLASGSDVSLRHATEKSRQSSAAAACLIASANVARNHVRSSGNSSETRRSPSLRREHNRSLSRQRPELVPAVLLNMGIGDLHSQVFMCCGICRRRRRHRDDRHSNGETLRLARGRLRSSAPPTIPAICK